MRWRAGRQGGAGPKGPSKYDVRSGREVGGGQSKSTEIRIVAWILQ